MLMIWLQLGFNCTLSGSALRMLRLAYAPELLACNTCTACRVMHAPTATAQASGMSAMRVAAGQW